MGKTRSSLETQTDMPQTVTNDLDRFEKELEEMKKELADIMASREAKQTVASAPRDWFSLEEETRDEILKLAQDVLSGSAASRDIDQIASKYPVQLAWVIEQLGLIQRSSAIKAIQSLNPYFVPRRSQIVSD
jgi:uncharacterized protein with von Willebrand factor type A (vWA) domain